MGDDDLRNELLGEGEQLLKERKKHFHRRKVQLGYLRMLYH